MHGAAGVGKTELVRWVGAAVDRKLQERGTAAAAGNVHATVPPYLCASCFPPHYMGVLFPHGQCTSFEYEPNVLLATAFVGGSDDSAQAGPSPTNSLLPLHAPLRKRQPHNDAHSTNSFCSARPLDVKWWTASQLVVETSRSNSSGGGESRASNSGMPRSVAQLCDRIAGGRLRHPTLLVVDDLDLLGSRAGAGGAVGTQDVRSGATRALERLFACMHESSSLRASATPLPLCVVGISRGKTDVHAGLLGPHAFAQDIEVPAAMGAAARLVAARGLGSIWAQCVGSYGVAQICNEVASCTVGGLVAGDVDRVVRMVVTGHLQKHAQARGGADDEGENDGVGVEMRSQRVPLSVMQVMLCSC